MIINIVILVMIIYAAVLLYDVWGEEFLYKQRNKKAAKFKYMIYNTVEYKEEYFVNMCMEEFIVNTDVLVKNDVMEFENDLFLQVVHVYKHLDGDTILVRLLTSNMKDSVSSRYLRHGSIFKIR